MQMLGRFAMNPRRSGTERRIGQTVQFLVIAILLAEPILALEE
jgi:hypothetical protein